MSQLIFYYMWMIYSSPVFGLMFREGIIRVVVDPTTNYRFPKERSPKYILGFLTMGLFHIWGEGKIRCMMS
mgnify:CR=1 FL=1